MAKWADGGAPPRERALRQAVHTVLRAIALSELLRPRTLVKGGMLLAFHYGSCRHTRDLDLSTEDPYSKARQDAVLAELSRALAIAVEDLDHGLDCRVQSWQVRPSRPDATFQTLKIRVGYAYKGSSGHRRLARGKASEVLDIDYSFNERTLHVEYVTVDSVTIDGQDTTVRAYGLIDLVAEKYRAILQQVTRDRHRRQDAFDIHLLLSTHGDALIADRAAVLESLLVKARSRNLEPSRDALADPEIERRSRAEYGQIAHEISGPLPPFDQVFARVRDYYQSLPWQ